MTDEIEIIIRQDSPDDRNFIFATWLRGNYYGCSYFRQMPQDVYYRQYSNIISNALRPENHPEIQIACDQGRPFWIAGFSVSQGPNLYWVYVKKDYRSRGIASLLLKDKPITTVKNLTDIGRTIAIKKGLIFNPL